MEENQISGKPTLPPVAPVEQIPTASINPKKPINTFFIIGGVIALFLLIGGAISFFLSTSSYRQTPGQNVASPSITIQPTVTSLPVVTKSVSVLDNSVTITDIDNKKTIQVKKGTYIIIQLAKFSETKITVSDKNLLQVQALVPSGSKGRYLVTNTGKATITGSEYSNCSAGQICPDGPVIYQVTIISE